MIAAIERSLRAFTKLLEALQVVADFRIRPVGCAHELSADHTVAVDGICFRPHVRVEKAGSALARVADGNQVDMAIPDEAGVRVRIVVDAHREDHDAGILMVELLQRGQFFDARGTLAPPEVQKHNFAAVIGKMNGSLSVRNGEVGSRFSGLPGVRATVAAKKQGQWQQQRNG